MAVTSFIIPHSSFTIIYDPPSIFPSSFLRSNGADTGYADQYGLPGYYREGTDLSANFCVTVCDTPASACEFFREEMPDAQIGSGRCFCCADAGLPCLADVFAWVTIYQPVG